MKTATLIGLSPIEFWGLTPYELFLLIEAHKQKTEQEAEEKITLAYINAFWTAQFAVGKKKPPRLEEIIKKKAKPKKMSPEEMLAQVKALNAMFGGKIRYETPQEKGGE